MGQQDIFICAGDPSGDNACCHLIKALQREHSSLRLTGLGGERMAALGQRQLADPHDLALIGFWEVAKRFLFFRKLLYECVDEIKRTKPAVVILVDYPGFNLRLAERIKSLGIPIVYYISPQVWAWKKNRIKQIARLVDLMLLILPFEEELYQQHKIPYKMVGHYLLEDIPAEYLDSTPPENCQIALLPGSRPQEIEAIMPSMLSGIKNLQERREVTAVVAGLSGVYDYQPLIDLIGPAKITVVYDDARRVVYESRLVLTASGTATLECGLIGRPMVVMYKTGWITYQIAKRLVTLKHIALANLILDEAVLPELIQAAANPDRIALELNRFLSDQTYYDKTAKSLRGLGERLGGVGASERAASAIGGYL